MAKFLRTKGAMDGVEEIIINAEKILVIISPFLEISNTYLARLKSAASKNIKIKIVCRMDKLNPELLTSLQSIVNIEIRHLDRLHAKCYFNERKMVLTSFNLIEASERNWEMGILINKDEDREIYNEVISEALTIFNEAKLNASFIKPLKKTKTESYKPNKQILESVPNLGYCIRCELKIPLSNEKPYCPSCYNSWKVYNNPAYTEKYCHCCGKPEATSINSPFCYNCFKLVKNNSGNKPSVHKQERDSLGHFLGTIWYDLFNFK